MSSFNIIHTRRSSTVWHKDAAYPTHILYIQRGGNKKSRPRVSRLPTRRSYSSEYSQGPETQYYRKDRQLWFETGLRPCAYLNSEFEIGACRKEGRERLLSLWPHREDVHCELISGFQVVNWVNVIPNLLSMTLQLSPETTV